MSLKILHAHIGLSYSVNPQAYTSLDELRSWIATKTGIQSPSQILMTARGKQVKFQTLTTDSEIFLYDRSVLASTSSASKLLPSFEPSSIPLTFDDPPESPAKTESLREIQAITKKHRYWAFRASEDARSSVEKVLQHENEVYIIRRATAIAVENVRQHIGNLRPKYEETKAWADQTSKDHALILEGWQSGYERLAHVVVGEKFSGCIIGGEAALVRSKARGSGVGITLQDYADRRILIDAKPLAEDFANGFRTRLGDLESTYQHATRGAIEFIDDYQHRAALSNSDIADQASRLLEEVEVLTKKIGSDYEHVHELSEGSKAVVQASRIAQLQRNNFIPSIVQTRDEIAQLAHQVIYRKKEVAQQSTLSLQQLSFVESKISSVHSKLAKLDLDLDAVPIFDLEYVFKLPSAYGQYLVEFVRRHEWTLEMQSTQALLPEDVTIRKERENRRRSVWGEGMDGTLEFTELGNINLDDTFSQHVSMRENKLADRDDVVRYLEQLRSSDQFKDALREVEQAARVFDQAPNQQNKVPIAFKNGSIHEASYSRKPSIPQANNQSFQDLRNEKAKVDDKLKSAESRIRKLEDLLHRQSQTPRPPSSGGFNPGGAPTFERHATSPVPNFTSALSKAREKGSRRSSTSSRRVSQNTDPEERNLAQRIVSLEAELIAQRAESKDLKQNAAVRLSAEENLKNQAREAIATKEDLLSNMEAQQHEFENERRLLEEENSRLNIRLEELEDEFDRVLNNEEQDGKLHALQEEIDGTRQEIQEIEASRNNERKTNQEKISNLEKEAQERDIRNNELGSLVDQLEDRLHNQKNAQTQQYRSLRTTLFHISKDMPVPNDLGALAEALEAVAAKSMAHQKELRTALDSAQTQNAMLEQRLEAQSEETYGLRRQLGSSEREMTSLRDASALLQARFDSAASERDVLQNELQPAKADLDKTKWQLSEERCFREELNKKFTSLQGFHSDLDDQLREKDDELDRLLQQHDKARLHSQAQANRADEVSRRLRLYVENFKKLLELVGFMIAKQEDSIVIQRVPKNATAASSALNDPLPSMRRSISGSLPTKAELESYVDSDTLRWARTEDPDEATARYEEFTKTFSGFDIDAFNEAIYKRIKDVEHIARKWQREAKAYREKAHRAQSDAHERIALRSFKEGDLALFLPTRDQATKPWAAFNVGAPHYFLREQDSHKLAKRDWLIARISKVEERVVNLSKSMNGLKPPGDRRSTTSGVSLDDENPYELSDGLRWYLLDAAEEKPGAPINIGTGKATVAMTREEEPIRASIGIKKPSDRNEATKTLARSLDSRRSSTNSRKSLAANTTSAPAGLEGMLKRTNSNASRKTGERVLLDVPDSQKAEPARSEEIQAVDMSSSTKAPDQVGIISAPDW